MKVTLDTNVLVRLATQDDPAQAALALKVLQKRSRSRRLPRRKWRTRYRP
jgi:predicted nucleic acid-binding protein